MKIPINFKIKFDNIYDFVLIKIISKEDFVKYAEVEFPNDNELPNAFTKESTIYFKEQSIKDIPLLTHELIHAVKYIMNIRNINDEEFLCYSIQFCLDKYIKKFLNNF